MGFFWQLLPAARLEQKQAASSLSKTKRLLFKLAYGNSANTEFRACVFICSLSEKRFSELTLYLGTFVCSHSNERALAEVGSKVDSQATRFADAVEGMA